MKFLKFFFINNFVLALCIAAALIFVFAFNSTPGCTGDSESAKYIRSLGDERLSKLYKDIEIFYKEYSQDSYLRIPKESLPKEFSDLNIVSLRPGRPQIMVEGCFDNYMYLEFYGIKDEKEKSIVLRYGEYEIIEELVWPK